MAAPRTVIHYMAPDESLPAPLPSVDQIVSSSTEFKSSGGADRRVVQVGEHFIAKYGKKVSHVEGLSMIFVRSGTNVSIPTVYAVYDSLDQDGVSTFIVMENVKGKSLDECALKAEEETSVTTQLRGQLDELRRIPPPSPAYFGCIGRLPYLPNYNHLSGPYLSEDDFIDRYLDITADMFELMLTIGRDVQYDEEDRIIKEFKSGGPPVFSHGDLALHNIILRPDGSVCIIDWELSGWYPEWYEYISTGRRCWLKFRDEYPEQERLMNEMQQLRLGF